MILKIAGMSCGHCTRKVEQALQAVPGVSHVKISLAAGEATLQYDEQLTSQDQLKAAVEEAGYSVDAADTTQEVQNKSVCACGCG